jgi:NADH-quinone oxidoreductase subunit J
VNPSSTQEIVAFAFFSALALVSAGATVAFKNPIRNAVALFVHIMALAGLYITLAAHFLVAVQLIVYIGAVVVLFVFVIMLLGPGAETTDDDAGVVPRALGAGSIALLGAMLAVNVFAFRPERPARTADGGTLRQVGQFLFSDGVIPFEVASVLLTAAVVGAFAVARAHHHKVKMTTETNRPRQQKLEAEAQGD